MSREAGERFTCPWCPTVIIAAPLGSALTVYELHLDEHYAVQMGGVA